MPTRFIPVPTLTSWKESFEIEDCEVNNNEIDISDNLPLDLSIPTTLEHRVLENNAPKINAPSDDHSFHIPSDYLLPHPDTFELTDDDDDVEMAGSFGRFMEAQREDNGVHFEAGGSGALVEPQSASRQVVNQDFRLDFSHLDLVPDGSPNPNYVPTTRDRSSDLDAASGQ
ncbi:hypothetical protein N7516_008058 [Penicillium verrucosum]|uniref:uncharacterized protein n=1 Tax=Penicillium verrucosum TaxID=60171 RepID=UPI002544E033|nr:uncharacterized protein N7516_008058 [Penicillium verrucosum]KAJ5926285.1 hypothetical protein N7516_008058 [Penicillium verrucosum]